MTLDEFNNYIQEFKKQPMPSHEGMTRGEGFYMPMLQVIDYLKANDFTVYIISGTDRFIVRGFMLCCDDLVRENGNEKKADDMYKMCAEHGWTAVSMKNDWTTIYGDGVTKVDTPALDQAA